MGNTFSNWELNSGRDLIAAIRENNLEAVKKAIDLAKRQQTRIVAQEKEKDTGSITTAESERKRMSNEIYLYMTRKYKTDPKPFSGRIHKFTPHEFALTEGYSELAKWIKQWIENWEKTCGDDLAQMFRQKPLTGLNARGSTGLSKQGVEARDNLRNLISK